MSIRRVLSRALLPDAMHKYSSLNRRCTAHDRAKVHNSMTSIQQGGSSPGSPTRTLILASLGGALEFYDFVIFVFFTSIISKLFFAPDVPEWLRLSETFGIFAAGYFAR